MIERLPQEALITFWQPCSSVKTRWAENLTEQQHLLHGLHVTRDERWRGFNRLQLDRLEVQQHKVRRFSVTAERRTNLGIYDVPGRGAGFIYGHHLVAIYAAARSHSKTVEATRWQCLRILNPNQPKTKNNLLVCLQLLTEPGCENAFQIIIHKIIGLDFNYNLPEIFQDPWSFLFSLLPLTCSSHTPGCQWTEQRCPLLTGIVWSPGQHSLAVPHFRACILWSAHSFFWRVLWRTHPNPPSQQPMGPSLYFLVALSPLWPCYR